MGKASSAKKVARAARASGRRSPREAPKVGFPLTIFVIVLLGSLLVVYARGSRDTASAESPSYTKKDHWHAAYGMYVCDRFLPPLQDAIEDRLGIHTHGEGIIHIHPFSAASSGNKARMDLFAKQIGVELLSDGWKMPDGTEYRTGYDCNGKPGKFAVYRWAVDDPNGYGDVFENDIPNIVFRADRDAYTFAIIPEGAEPPPLPPSVGELDNLTDVAPGEPGAAPQAGTESIPGLSLPPLTESSVPTGGASTDSTTPTSVAATPTGSAP